MAGSETENVTFDPSDLTVKEVKELQNATGKKFGEIIREFRTEDFDVETLQVIAWLVRRRKEPGLSLEMVEDARLSDFMGGNGSSPNP